ncbi:MAG TPA: MFS transporter [Thermomicrobiales bacterium]|nr:MFS transporter [Thermomicrobiales bacterium]
MRAYIQNLRRIERDVGLFLLFQLLANVGYGVFQLVFNLYLYELDLREDFIGAVSAAQTVFMAIAGVSLGLFINRLGSWRCISGGTILFLATLIGLAFAERQLILVVLAALSGIGLAYLFNTTMPFIMDWTRPDQRTQVAALAFSLISLAITVGSLVGGVVPSLLAWSIGSIDAGSATAYRWTMIVGAIIAFSSLIPLWMMGEARRGRPREEQTAALVVETPTERRRVRLDMTAFIMTGGVMSLGVGMVIPFYNVFLATLGANSRQIGYVYALGGLAAAIVGLGAPAVANRLGPLRAVFVVRTSILPFYALLILSPVYGVAILAHMVRQTSISMAWPIDSTFIGELLPRRARSSVFGLRSAAWNFGYALASVIGGEVIVRSGYNATFIAINLFTFLSALIFVGYFRRHPRVRSGEVGSVAGRPVTVNSMVRRWPWRKGAVGAMGSTSVTNGKRPARASAGLRRRRERANR